MIDRPEADLSRQGITLGAPLDALNFFRANARDGLGQNLAICLLTQQHGDQAWIGLVMSIAAIAGLFLVQPRRAP